MQAKPGGDSAGAREYAGSYVLPELNLTRHYMEGRALDPALVPQILELLRIAFNGGPKWFDLDVPPAKHFLWKFVDFPGLTEAAVTFERSGELVGFIGAHHRRWLVQGAELVARDGLDLCRHPRWQGRGVMRALRPFAHLERHPAADFTLGWVTHPADRKISIESGGFPVANPAHDYVRLLGLPWRPRRGGSRARVGESDTSDAIIARSRSRWRPRARTTVLALHWVLASLRRRPFRRPREVTVETVSSFDERHEDLAALASREFDLIAVRSRDLLNWRYADWRAGPFIIREATRRGELVGYAVTRVVNSEAHVADILAAPGEVGIAETLIHDAIDLAANGGAGSIRCRLPNRHPYAPALDRAGFIDLGAAAGEMINPRDMEPSTFDFLLDPDVSVHVVFGDSDTV